jgi:radical SAM superfamily enzyme YgiQ (UPF0313 family)
MKVLLVYPDYPETFWSYKHALKFIHKKASLPPLGLLTVSSMLPKEWEKKLIDLNVNELKDEDIIDSDMVFISSMIVQIRSSREIIKRVKAFGKFIVAGGPLFSSMYKDFPDVDCFVLNEGESTIPLFLSDLKKGQLKHIYKSNERPDISNTPVPDWSIINTNDYASLALQVSRGCPFSCDFCDIIVMNGRVPRVKTSSQVIAELDAIYNTGWRGGVFIVDDNFIGNRKKVKIILEDISEWMSEHNKPFSFSTEASITVADDIEIIGLLKKSNFSGLFVGIETPDEESLKSCGKYQNTGKDLREKVNFLQRNGLEVKGGFIVGFDTDNALTFDKMIGFIQHSGIVTAMVGLLHALPKTALYKKLKKEGRILSAATGNNTDSTLNFAPVMNKDELLEGYKRIVDTIYKPRYYYERMTIYLREYRQFAKSSKFSFKLKVMAISRSLWVLGVTERGKIHFWKMFIWTLLHKPKLIPEAITQSIYGYHYRTVLLNNNNTDKV